jgi:hypothetical protein
MQSSKLGTQACVCIFPFNMLESFGTTGKVRVSGAIDGVPYSGKPIPSFT